MKTYCYQCGGETEIYADGPSNYLAQCLDCQQVQSLPATILDALFVRNQEHTNELQTKQTLDLSEAFGGIES